MVDFLRLLHESAAEAGDAVQYKRAVLECFLRQLEQCAQARRAD